MKKLRKGTQLKLTNPKNAGRRAIHDRGIRHLTREKITSSRPLHVTVKLKRADIQTKYILKALGHAICLARKKGIRIIHYSLECNHVHLYAEVSNNLELSKGMQAFGVSLVKKINKYFGCKGSVYKHRYHLRILKSASEVKNVINYILKNGIKHQRTRFIFDRFNSAAVIHDYRLIGIKVIKADIHLIQQKNYLRSILDDLILYKNELKYIRDT